MSSSTSEMGHLKRHSNNFTHQDELTYQGKAWLSVGREGVCLWRSFRWCHQSYCSLGATAFEQRALLYQTYKLGAWTTHVIMLIYLMFDHDESCTCNLWLNQRWADCLHEGTVAHLDVIRRSWPLAFEPFVLRTDIQDSNCKQPPQPEEGRAEQKDREHLPIRCILQTNICHVAEP